MKQVHMWVLAGLIGLIGTGCVNSLGTFRASHGSSYELARSNQVRNPEAGANLELAEGFDGGAAQHAIKRYQKSFEQAPTRPRFVLPIEDIRR